MGEKGQEDQNASTCEIFCRLVGQIVAEIWQLIFFSIWRWSAILDLLCVTAHVWNIHEEHLVVFMAVQNLVEIGAVVLIIGII